MPTISIHFRIPQVKKIDVPKERSGKKAVPSSAQSNIILILAAVIFAPAFLVRFVYLTQIKSSFPFFSEPGMDELYHDTRAQQIAAGNWIGSEPFFKGTLYVYLLASICKIFGHNYYPPLSRCAALSIYQGWF